MKELNIGETKVRVRATPLALLYYKQEFKSDLLGDLAKLGDLVNMEDVNSSLEETKAIEADLSKLDSVSLLQLTWAMAKADAHGSKFPSFEEWLSTLTCFDFSDLSLISAVMEEAADGFFRQGSKGLPIKK